MQIPDRNRKEEEYARVVAALLKAYQRRVMEELGRPPKYENIPLSFFERERERMVAGLRPLEEELFRDGAMQLARAVGV